MGDHVRVLLLWCFVLALLSLGVTLVFCVALQGIFQPDVCHTLLEFVSNTFWGEARR